MSEHDPRIPSDAELSQLAIGRFESSMRGIMALHGALRHRGALMLRAYADLLESCVPSEQLMPRMDSVLDSLKPVIGGGSPQPNRRCDHCSDPVYCSSCAEQDGA